MNLFATPKEPVKSQIQIGDFRQPNFVVEAKMEEFSERTTPHVRVIVTFNEALGPVNNIETFRGHLKAQLLACDVADKIAERLKALGHPGNAAPKINTLVCFTAEKPYYFEKPAEAEAFVKAFPEVAQQACNDLSVEKQLADYAALKGIRR